MMDYALTWRQRLALRLSRPYWWLVRHAPNRIGGWLAEPSHWYSRAQRIHQGAICATLGHVWVVCSDGPPYAMMMCDGCTALCASDDVGPDTHGDDTVRGRRDLRDWLVATATRQLEWTEDRHTEFARQIRERLVPMLVREALESTDEATRDRMTDLLVANGVDVEGAPDA